MEGRTDRPVYNHRRFGQTAVIATGVWIAPSVMRLDRIAAATPSVPYTDFYTEDFQGAVGGHGALWYRIRACAILDKAHLKVNYQCIYETVMLGH